MQSHKLAFFYLLIPSICSHRPLGKGIKHHSLKEPSEPGQTSWVSLSTCGNDSDPAMVMVTVESAG